MNLKKILFLTALISFNSFASDIVQRHQKMCESPEAIAFTGEKGHCSLIPRVLDVPGEKKGYCVGKLMGSIDCAIVFLKNAEITGMNIVCATDPKKPLLNQSLQADFISYQMSAMLNNAKGESYLIKDSSTYTSFKSGLASVLLTTKEDGITVGEFSINLRGAAVPLTEVNCQ
jgi:hypothetical protein